MVLVPGLVAHIWAVGILIWEGLYSVSQGLGHFYHMVQAGQRGGWSTCGSGRTQEQNMRPLGTLQNKTDHEGSKLAQPKGPTRGKLVTQNRQRSKYGKHAEAPTSQNQGTAVNKTTNNKMLNVLKHLEMCVKQWEKMICCMEVTFLCGNYSCCFANVNWE